MYGSNSHDMMRLQAEREAEEMELRQEALRSFRNEDESAGSQALPDGLNSAGAGGNEQVTVEGIQSVGPGSTLRLSDGRAVSINKVNFGDYETQAMYEVAAEFPDSLTANRFLQIYRDSGLKAPEFLQLYHDVLREDVQGQTAQGSQGGKDALQSVDLASDRISLLAKNNGSGIIKEGRQQLTTDGSKASPGMGNMPLRALAANGTVTDVPYANGAGDIWPQSGAPFYVTDEHGNIQYGADGEVDIEMVDSYPGVTPRPTPVPSPTPTPSPTAEPASTPCMPEYTTNIGGKSGYARNTNAYQGVNESSLMPLGYQKQTVSDMGFYEFVYAGGSLKNSKEDGLVDCVGMNRLPGITWFSQRMYEKLEKEGKLSTVVGYLYGNAARKGKMTPEMEDQKFDGMQLISEKVRTLEDGTKEKYKNHIVTYYEEITMEFPVGKDLSKFEDCEQNQVRVVYSPDKKQDVQLVTFYDVVVHISGKSYGYKKDGKVLTNDEVDELNKKEKKEIIIDPYQPGKYKYWCALDYVDYGDQAIPESNK